MDLQREVGYIYMNYRHVPTSHTALIPPGTSGETLETPQTLERIFLRFLVWLGMIYLNVAMQFCSILYFPLESTYNASQGFL